MGATLFLTERGQALILDVLSWTFFAIIVNYKKMEVPTGIEPVYAVLQTAA